MSTVKEQMKNLTNEVRKVLDELKTNDEVSTDAYYLGKLMNLEARRIILALVVLAETVEGAGHALDNADIW